MENKSEKRTYIIDDKEKGCENHIQNSIQDYSFFYDTVTELINNTEQSLDVLDLGCGTGLELKGIFSKIPNAHITGIDLSLESLKILQTNFDNRTQQLSLIQGSFMGYPLGQNYFDYIISVMSVHYFLEEDKLKLYQKILKSLKPGGIYIESDFIAKNNEQETEYLKTYYKKKRKLADNKLYLIDIPMTVKKQTKILLKSGFENVEIIRKAENQVVIKATKSCEY